MFDRSWYNRAGVEPVMGFCTPDQHAHFLEETPHFERMPVKAGIHLFKFWLNIGQRNAAQALPRPAPLEAQALEAVADGHREPEQVGRLHRQARPDAQGRPTRNAPWTVVKRQ
jgi:hypothetical protein